MEAKRYRGAEVQRCKRYNRYKGTKGPKVQKVQTVKSFLFKKKGKEVVER